jgi:hypothetical protein
MHEKGGILHKLFNTYYKKEYQRRKFCRYQRDIFNSINRRRKHIAMNKRRRTYNDITQKRANKRHLLKAESELRYFARVSSSCSIYGINRVTVATNPVIVMDNKHSIFVVICNTTIP